MCTLQGPLFSLRTKILFWSVVGFLLGFGMFNLAKAEGDVAHVTVTLPTGYTDETPLAASDIAEIHVQWFRPGVITPAGEKVLPSTQLTVDIPGMKCGDYNFTGYIVTSPNAKYPGTSLPITKPYNTGIACVPKAPGLAVH